MGQIHYTQNHNLDPKTHKSCSLSLIAGKLGGKELDYLSPDFRFVYMIACFILMPRGKWYQLSSLALARSLKYRENSLPLLSVAVLLSDKALSLQTWWSILVLFWLLLNWEQLQREWCVQTNRELANWGLEHSKPFSGAMICGLVLLKIGKWIWSASNWIEILKRNRDGTSISKVKIY